MAPAVRLEAARGRSAGGRRRYARRRYVSYLASSRRCRPPGRERGYRGGSWVLRKKRVTACNYGIRAVSGQQLLRFLPQLACRLLHSVTTSDFLALPGSTQCFTTTVSKTPRSS